MQDVTRPPRTRPRHRRLKPADQARLLDVALRRLDGQPWKFIAAELGWNSRQAAEGWASRAITRWEYWKGVAP